MKRIVRSILNKLTLEKFDALYEQLALCGLSTPEDMSILMQEVFEKATLQHHFIEMYADLCVRLEADPRLASARGAEGEATSFRHLLLGQCQSAFLRLLETQATTSEDQEVLRKKVALGNVKFVGHLMLRGMLNSRLLIVCSEALLRNYLVCSEALESAAVLLTVTGKHFESFSGWQYVDRLSAIFDTIGHLTKEKRVCARSRFLLRDLLELREAGWPIQARAAVAKEKPMLLEEVREQAQSAHCVAPRRPQMATWQAKPTSMSGAAPFVPKESVRATVTVTEVVQRSTPAVVVKAAFDLKAFRKYLNVVVKDLSSHRNVSVAVRCVRAENVPLQHQARLFADLLTRTAEETRGLARRIAFAFIAGLVVGETPAFSPEQCFKGVSIFFSDIFEDLKEEVPNLERMVIAEMLCTLRSVLPVNELNSVLPSDFIDRIR